MEKQEILLESGTNEMELMAFRIGASRFGLNVAKILAIQQYDPALVTHIPLEHPAMMGMMLYRKRTIPLVDLAVSLKIGTEQDNERPIVMITEFNNTTTGFRVDRVDRIYRLHWHDFTPIDSLLSSYGESIIGSVHVDDSEILVVDLERILADIYPEQVIEELTKETIEKSPGVSRENMRLFFAEDSRTIREAVVCSLKKIGFKNIQVFDNGQKAYDALASLQAQIKKDATAQVELPHLLLTDIEMPMMDGLTLCKKTKEELGLLQIPVIMFSSLINEQMMLKCQEVGASGYITKPEINTLIGIMDKICQDAAACRPSA